MRLRYFTRRRVELCGRGWSVGWTTFHRWQWGASCRVRPDRSGAWTDREIAVGPLRVWFATFPARFPARAYL